MISPNHLGDNKSIILVDCLRYVVIAGLCCCITLNKDNRIKTGIICKRKCC